MWVKVPARQTVRNPADVLFSNVLLTIPPYLPIPLSSHVAGPLPDMYGGSPFGGSLDEVVIPSTDCMNCEKRRVRGKTGRVRRGGGRDRGMEGREVGVMSVKDTIDRLGVRVEGETLTGEVCWRERG